MSEFLRQNKNDRELWSPVLAGSAVPKNRLAREILNRVDEQAQRPMSLVTVRDFIETRFKTDVILALKHAGQKHYGYILDKHVLPAMGGLRLRDVTTDQVQALVKGKFEAGYSVQTIVHIRNAVSAVFNHAKLKGALSRGQSHERRPAARDAAQGNPRIELFPGARFAGPVSDSGTGDGIAFNDHQPECCRDARAALEKSEPDGDAVVVGSEVLPPSALTVRENYYRGKFGTVKAKSRRRTVPLSATVIAALASLRAKSKFIGPDDLVFA